MERDERERLDYYRFCENQKKYDYVQFVVPDIYGTARGKIFRGKFKEKVAKQGLEFGTGPNGVAPVSCLPLVGPGLPNEEARPCLDTLTPWPWVSACYRQVGSVLCDLFRYDGTPDPASPRQLMKAQLARLKEKHGLEFRSAFEYEFNVYTDGEAREPLLGNSPKELDVGVLHEHHELLCGLFDVLEAMGVEVSSVMAENTPGQLELTTDIQKGERGGDVAFYLKHAVKGYFRSKGMTATFMSKPRSDHGATGLHLNHSLWTAAEEGVHEERVEEAFSEREELQRNVLLDDSDPDSLSDIARHWIAGLVHHAPAMTALCCPTLNCYRRLGGMCVPTKADWGPDNRNCTLRARAARGNVFLENRLPSGAANPYLAIAATLAAGMDGLERRLPCPPPIHQSAATLPSSLAEALEALEQDQELVTSLGPDFVKIYLAVKLDVEVVRFKQANLKSEEQQFEFERKMFLNSV